MDLRLQSKLKMKFIQRKKKKIEAKPEYYEESVDYEFHHAKKKSQVNQLPGEEMFNPIKNISFSTTSNSLSQINENLVVQPEPLEEDFKVEENLYKTIKDRFFTWADNIELVPKSQCFLDYLKNIISIYGKMTMKDGNSLFRSVSAVFNNNPEFNIIRKETLKEICKNSNVYRKVASTLFPNKNALDENFPH